MAPKNGELKIDAINSRERPHYFAGRYLLEGDFELQHDYLNDRLRYHRCSLHVSGIVEGLEVTPESDKKSIQVSPGSAIDSAGNLIVLKVETLPIELKKEGEGNLFICYRETDDAGSRQGEQATNWQDSPVLIFEPEQNSQNPVFFVPDSEAEGKYIEIFGDDLKRAIPETEELLSRAVILNKLTVGDSSVEVQDRGDYSGLRFPSADGEVTLRSDGQQKPGVELKGSLSVTGSLTVKEDLIIKSVMVRNDETRHWLSLKPDQRLWTNSSAPISSAIQFMKDTGCIKEGANNDIQINLQNTLICLGYIYAAVGVNPSPPETW